MKKMLILLTSTLLTTVLLTAEFDSKESIRISPPHEVIQLDLPDHH